MVRGFGSKMQGLNHPMADRLEAAGHMPMVANQTVKRLSIFLGFSLDSLVGGSRLARIAASGNAPGLGDYPQRRRLVISSRDQTTSKHWPGRHSR
ncbi:MAG: hypothetical protein A3F78_09110 [Burkholderiales bacterium RIFCSPLOWO2_12_FULL_61_40]|nr:MAG: hypothetical protein A3F78_09110 [Burkholderiales bacterium RIFCSPLOWO2_12_FULL_61_40]